MYVGLLQLCGYVDTCVLVPNSSPKTAAAEEELYQLLLHESLFIIRGGCMPAIVTIHLINLLRGWRLHFFVLMIDYFLHVHVGAMRTLRREPCSVLR